MRLTRFRMVTHGFLLQTLVLVGAAQVVAQTPPGGVPIPSSADFGDAGDRFGSEIEMDGNWAVATGLNREAYFVYERVDGTYTRRQRIVTPTLGQVGPSSVQLRGNRLLISRAFGEGFASQGRVWVYERSAPGEDFILAATVTPDSGQAGDRFGYGLALSADRIYVGAPGRDEAVVDQGAVYVFLLTGGNWVQEAKLVMPDPTVSDRYGFALDFDGQDLLIGARQHRGNPVTANRRGAVYVYRLQTGVWTQMQKLEQPIGMNQNIQLGYDLNAENGRAAIAAPGAGIPAVYFAVRDGGGVWSYSVLPAPLAGTGHFPSFLSYVDLDADLIAISVQSALDAPLSMPGPSYAVVWREVAGNWTVTAQRQRPDGNGTETAGVRLANNWMLVGAPADDASARNVDQGSILSYSLINGVTTPRQRLWHGNGNSPDYLGAQAALDGDHAVTIAPGADNAAQIDRGALHFLRRDGGSGWSFVQSVPGNADSGAALAVNIAGDLAYALYPEAQIAGLPAPVVRVFQRDGGGVWNALCDLQPPAGTTNPIHNVLAASSAGVMTLMDGDRVVWYPAPVGAACPLGTLMPNAPAGGQYVGIGLEGNVATLLWAAFVNGADRNGVDVYDLVATNWTPAQSFVGTAINGFTAESFDLPRSNGANQLLIRHAVPVSTLDRRFDIELWQRPSVGSAFAVVRTFTSPTPTGGYEGGVFAGSAVVLNDPSIGPNSGLAVYDPLTGVRVQELIPAGLTVEDDLISTVDSSGDRGMIALPYQNRNSINHAGMVYMFEPLVVRGTPTPLFATVVPQSLPPAGGDALFFDGAETTPF